MMMTEAFRLGVVYVHLIACCVALGAILMSDARIVWRLVAGRVPEMDSGLHALHRLISISLVVLWATGISFVWADANASSLMHTLSNPKLAAKIILVCVLTLNGLLLNSYVLPRLAARGSLLMLEPGERRLALLAGAVSGVSWLYAAFMGMARVLSWKYPLTELLAPYPPLLAATFAGMWMVTTWARLNIKTGAVEVRVQHSPYRAKTRFVASLQQDARLSRPGSWRPLGKP